MADISKISPDDGSTFLDIKDANGRVMSEQLTRDTVGWTGKNNYPSEYTPRNANTVVTKTSTGINVTLTTAETWDYVESKLENLKHNVDYVLTSDLDFSVGTVLYSIHGTNDWSSFTKLAETGNINTSGHHDIAFNSGNYKYIRIKLFVSTGTAVAANVNFNNLMIVRPNVDYTTYEPYHDNVSTEITDAYKVMGELGAKNCIPYPYTQSTQTINDVTFTVNSDGTIEVNGTASAETTFFLTGQVNQWSYAGGEKNLLKTGRTYILTDGDGAGTTTTYYLCCAMKNTNNHNVLVPQTGTNATGIYGNTFTVPDQDLAYIIYIRVNNGVTLNNKVFKPMIRLASDSDSTYQPYAMTNKELTDAVTPVDIASELTVEIGTLNNGASKILKTGRLITLSMQLTGVTANANQALAKLPKKYRPVNNIQFFGGIILSGEDNLRQVAYTSTTDYLEFQCPYAISNKTVTFITVSWIIQ